MKSRPASSASRASVRQSGQLAAQRSGTLVAERPDEQLAPNSPILSALPLYMAMRFPMDALRASTAFLPGGQIIIAAMIAPIKPIEAIAICVAREIGRRAIGLGEAFNQFRRQLADERARGSGAAGQD